MSGHRAGQWRAEQRIAHQIESVTGLTPTVRQADRAWFRAMIRSGSVYEIEGARTRKAALEHLYETVQAVSR